MNSSDPAEFETWLDEKAAEWLVERAEGFSPGRADDFVKWCNQDTRHAAAVCRVEQAMQLLDEMPFVRERIEQRVRRLPEEVKPRQRPSRLKQISIWTAGVAAILALGIFVSGFPNRAPAPEMQAADTTSPRRVALSDGSVIDLNARSSVKVEFSQSERRITLIAGEAFFQVAHNKSRPFIVVANGVAVRAVGTAFNVKLVGEKVDVVVTEGRVELAVPSWTTESAVPILSVGERTQIFPDMDAKPNVETIALSSVRTLLAWQDRMTSFTDVPLREMVARLNRCNSTKLVLDDPSLGEQKIGGVIDLSQVNAFVRLLEQGGDIIAERRIDDEIVLRRAR